MTGTFIQKNMKRILLAVLILAILGTLIFIFSNSVKSKEQSSDQSSEFAESIKPIVDPSDKIPFNIFEHHVRKLAHFSEFCLLGFELLLLLALLCNGYKNITLLKYTSTMFLALTAALIDETIQIFSDRGSAVVDVWIDFSGAITGSAFGFLILILFSFISSKRKNKDLKGKKISKKFIKD